MKKSCFVFLALFAIILYSPQQVFALATEYLRNGECYMLIGEGTSSLRGIYRLNDPVTEIRNLDLKVIPGTDVNNTLGFNVDLYKNIYTFSEQVESSWQDSKTPLYRQVVDDEVTADHSDYGYHSYIHYDHRPWKTRTDGSSCANVYRTGPVGRSVHKDLGGAWSGFKSAGPGTLTSKPAGYTLPVMTGAASCGEYSGKKWYQIPNASWYSSWKTAWADPAGDAWAGSRYPRNGYNTFFYVFGDRVQEKNHNYKLFTWTPNNISLDAPNYSKDIGNTVAQTKEERTSRDVYAGCLDGCGGASGSGSAEAAKMLSDIAFQPPMKSNPSRTYFYSRTVGTPNWNMTLNNSPINPPIIGKPAALDTYWLCISLKSAVDDFVYTLGTSVINDWYKQACGSSLSNMNITAVTVSNQWDQEGGIVYAYDKYYKKIYKFEREEKSGTPITSEGFLAIDVAELMKKVEANTVLDLDDIKSDGFGSLYFAISHPSKNVNDGYDPRTKFEPNDCIHVHKTNHDPNKGETDFIMIYKQDYGKVVYERNYLNPDKVQEIGRKNYARRMYNVSCKIKDAGWNQLSALGFPNSQVNNILASWSATVAGVTYNTPINPWPKTYYQTGCGACTHYYDYNYNNPGNCKLAVINVPTPPKVISLGNDKSYLDLIGPFLGTIPNYNGDTRKTQQTGFEPYEKVLNQDQIYFYMVENYPIPDGGNVSQDPTEQLDYDNDKRQGGFITTIQDRNPKDDDHPDGITYEWNTWLVKNYLGQPCCDLARTNVGSYFDYVYSPVPGSFIVTCKVKYNWYNYNELNFGDTIEDRNKVLKKNVYALPCTGLYNKSTRNGVTHLIPQTRLDQIKSTKAFSFMNGAKDENGKTIDYEKLIIGSADDASTKDVDESEFLAIEAYTIGGTASGTPEASEFALIERCDHLDGNQDYLKNDSYWSKPGADGFGIDSNETYHWRIVLASQTNLIKDISTCNGTEYNRTAAKDSANYNYVAERMINPDYKGTTYVNGNPDFQFRNQLGELRWANNSVMVTAKLYIIGPDGVTNTVPLVNNDPNNPGVASIPLEIKPDGSGYYPVLAEPTSNLPPTDPKNAEIQITMRREYRYDMWAFKDGQPWFPVKNLPGFITLEGKAKVRIIDNKPPRIVWSKTNPNNLFGITGRDLKEGDGRNGKKNPSNINIYIKDDNPWDAIESEKGLNLAQHNDNYSANVNIRNNINNLKLQRKPTSSQNLKPVFSREAKEVRLYFETAQRQTDNENKGKVKVDRADKLYTGTFSVTGRNFDMYDSEYLFYYKNDGTRYEKSLKYASSTYDCSLTSFYSETRYDIPLSGLKLGTDGTNMTRTVPDGYANNTPGYRPYKFFVSSRDSSGNDMASKTLNLVLNVKDDIPPMGYGSMFDSKTQLMSYFPYRNVCEKGSTSDKENTCSYSLSGEKYFALTLNDSLIRSNTWVAEGANGFINGLDTGITYRAMSPTQNDAIVTKANSNSLFNTQVSKNISPRATEDNVECGFEVYVSDNCGGATATLTLSWYGFGTNSNSLSPLSKTITSGWRSGAEIDSKNILATESIYLDKSIENTYHLIFRGEANDFPMQIPIVITATDDARDWDYYNPPSWDDKRDDYDNWTDGRCVKGDPAVNTRKFRTSLGVFGSQLDIRVLDKTIKNE